MQLSIHPYNIEEKEYFDQPLTFFKVYQEVNGSQTILADRMSWSEFPFCIQTAILKEYPEIRETIV